MSTFVLGVGAQKSGTSWLFQNLATQPYSDFGFTKEYHVFDCISDDKINLNYTNTLTADQFNTIKNFRKNTTAYFDYFQNMLNHTDVKLSGDITPSYTCLPAEVFMVIKNEFNKRNITVKPILIMRNPVYRLHSMTHMFRGPFRSKSEMLSSMHELHLDQLDKHRSCYDVTIQNLNAVFGKENVFYALYEGLFDDSTIDNLSQFLDLEFINTFKLTEKINAATDKLDISEDEYLFFKARYAKLYDYCKNELGLPVDEQWKYNERVT